MSITYKGNAAEAFWGVPDSIFSGRVKSVKIDTDGEEVELPDSNGETDGVVMLNEKDVITLEVIYDSEYTPPSRGDSITVNSITGIVQSVGKSWEAKGFRGCTVKATKWANLDA